jgi:diguanylate cyclase (GGDEF)-like protein
MSLPVRWSPWPRRWIWAGWALSAAVAVPWARWHDTDLGALAVVVISGITMAMMSGQNTRLLASMRTDFRTGLLTMEAWRREATAELSRAGRHGTPLAVAIIDVDHFKNVNDTFGQLIGDAVLRAVADILRAQLRRYDRAGRYGGDEFVVLLPGTTAEQAARIATRLCEQISSAPVLAGTSVTVTASIGISQLTSAGSGLDDLLAAADAGLYASKRAGRCRVRAGGTVHRTLCHFLSVVDIPLMRSTDRLHRRPQRDSEGSGISVRETADVTELQALQAAQRHVWPGLAGQDLLRETGCGPQGLQAIAELLAVHQVQRLDPHALRERGQPVRARLRRAGLVLRYVLRRYSGETCQLAH